MLHDYTLKNIVGTSLKNHMEKSQTGIEEKTKIFQFAIFALQIIMLVFTIML
jgi:hypothetical protein